MDKYITELKSNGDPSLKKNVCQYRQPEKRSEYQTLVLNDRPFGIARACAYAHMIFTAVSKRVAVN